MSSQAINLESGLVAKPAASAAPATPAPSAMPAPAPGPQQAATPQAAPASGNIDLSSGLVAKDQSQPDTGAPADDGNNEGIARFMYGDDFVEKVKRGEISAKDALLHAATAHYKGALKGAGETVHTVGNLINKIPVVGETLAPKAGLDSLDQMTTAHGAAEFGGKTAEAIGEFMLGDEVLKGLSYADKLKKMAPVVKIFENYPRLAKTLMDGIRAGTVATGQSLAHGSNLGDALENGAITAGTGVVAEGAIQGGSAVYNKIKSGTTEIAGETMPKLASQTKGHAPLAEKVATIDNAPKIAEAQQKGTQKAVKNVARKAAEDSVTRVNATRVPVTEEVPISSARVQNNASGESAASQEAIGRVASEKSQGIKRVKITKAGQEVPLFGVDAVDARAGRGETIVMRYPDGREVIQDQGAGANYSGPKTSIDQGIKTRNEKTQLGSTAATVPDKLMPTNKLADEIGTTAATVPDKVLEPKTVPPKRTITVDRTTAPKFDQANVDASKVQTFADAADHVESAAKPVYEKLDQVSGGKFTALREQRKAALQVLRDPASIDAWEGAQKKLSEAEQGIDDLFSTHSDQVGRTDLKAANAAWKDAKTLDKIHTAVERSFNGVPENIADRTGVARVLKGNKLKGNLGTLLQKSGQAEIERVIGKDGVDNLYRIADLTSTPESTAATQDVAKNVAKYLTHRYGTGGVVGGAVGSAVGHPAAGAFIGASLQDTTMRILHEAAVNPRVGKMIGDAVKVGASPKIYTALISSHLMGQDQDAKK